MSVTHVIYNWRREFGGLQFDYVKLTTCSVDHHSFGNMGPQKEDVVINDHQVVSRKDWVPTYAAIVIGAWCLNYPGRLTSDSYDMLVQARFIDSLNNWHSAVVTWIWSLLSPPLRQPSGALLIQCLLLFPYPAALLVDRSANRIISVLLTLGLIALSGLIAKDLILVAAILCALGALNYLRGPGRVWAAGAAVIVALLVRPTNFVLFAIPAIVWVSSYLRGWRFFATTLVIIAISISTLPISAGISKFIFGAKDAFPEKQLVIFDVAGMSTNLQSDLFATLPTWPGGNLPKPWECYTGQSWDPFAFHGKCKDYADNLSLVASKIGKGQVLKWWIEQVAAHPIAYIQHRLLFAFALVRHLTRFEVLPANSPGFDISQIWTNGKDTKGMFISWDPGIKFVPVDNLERLLLKRILVILSILVCVLSLIFELRNRTASLIGISGAIGVANYFMLVVFGAASEGRYMLPTLVCGVLCTIAFLRQKFPKGAF